MITGTLQNSLTRLGVQTDQKPIMRTPPHGTAVAVAGLRQQLAASAYSETFSLSITTREGDQVQVDVRQMLAGLQARDMRFAGAATPQGVAVVGTQAELEAGMFEARFGLHVRGDLNEREMVALKQIFEQVGRLADEFYGGDVEGALKVAQQLRADPSQIGALDLDITQRFTQVQARHQAVAAYVAVAQDAQKGPWPPVKAAQQVARYWAQVEQVQATIRETFRRFSLSIEFMMGGGDQREVSAIEQVHEQIAEAVGEIRQLLGEAEQPVQQNEERNGALEPEATQKVQSAQAHKGNEGATVKAETAQQAARPEAAPADTPRNQVEAMA